MKHRHWAEVQGGLPASVQRLVLLLLLHFDSLLATSFECSVILFPLYNVKSDNV